jgi:hypothetical protein
LYAGTETGVFVSLDDGKSWRSLSENLPAVPVVDLEVKNNDLVIATNGRGLWVMDDITPIRENNKRNKKSAMLFDVPDHTRFGYNWWMDYAPGGDPQGMKKYFVQNQRPNHIFYELGLVNGEKRREFLNTGDAKSLGVAMYFELTREPKTISLSILDDRDNVVRHYSKDEMRLNISDANDSSYNSGLNKFVWDMRYDGVEFINLQPLAASGKYKVRLDVDGAVQTSMFKLSINPNENYSNKQLDAKEKFWMELYSAAKSSSQKIKEALAVKDEVEAKAGSSEAAMAAAEEVARLVDAYKAVYIPKGRTLAEIINQPSRIFSKMVWLHNMAELSEGPANQPMIDQFADLNTEMVSADAEYQRNIEQALASFEKARGR